MEKSLKSEVEITSSANSSSSSSLSNCWRSLNEVYSSSSSSSSDAETVIFKSKKVSSKITESLPREIIGMSSPLYEGSSCINQTVANVNSGVDTTVNFKEQMDEYVELSVIPHEPLSNGEEVSMSLDKKMEISWNETVNVKKKMFKLFDFLEEIGDNILGRNMEKIRRQRERFSTMCNTWESTCKDFLLQRTDSEHLNFLSNTMGAVINGGYVDQLSEERLYYRAKVSKLYRKYSLAMSELHKLRQELISKDKSGTVAKLDDNHGHYVNTTNVIPSMSSTDLVNVFEYENAAPNYKLLQIKSHYEAQLVSSDKVHESLQEQNRLLCTQITLLRDENEMLFNRCMLLEKNGLHFSEHDTKLKEMELRLGHEEKYHRGKDTWLAQQEDWQCQSQVFYKSEVEGGRNMLEYRASILHTEFGNETFGELEKQMVDLKFELEKSKDMTEIHRVNVEDANSEIAALKSRQTNLQNELQRANETVKNLRTELKGVKEANRKFSEFKKTTEEITTSIHNLEINLHQQKVTTDRLLLMSEEFKEKDKYKYFKAADPCFKTQFDRID